MGLRAFVRLACGLASAAALAGCTNYTAESPIVNPPIILSIATEDNGYLLEVSAQNVELGFAGYRLYTGATPEEAQNQPAENGVDCGGINLQPNQAVVYFIEAKPGQDTVTPGTSNRICAIPVDIQAGQYVALRALIFNVTTFGTSLPSNAVLAP